MIQMKCQVILKAHVKIDKDVDNLALIADVAHAALCRKPQELQETFRYD